MKPFLSDQGLRIYNHAIPYRVAVPQLRGDVCR
jgi:hypothetical protein